MLKSTTTPELVFYDLSSKLKPQFWSPNTGKVRTLLNYLKIEYKLEFLRYPDIAPKLKSLGVKSWQEQHVEAYNQYSVPAVTFKTAVKEETIMGGEYFIIDKLVEYFGSECYDKIYDGDEKFSKLVVQYIQSTHPLIFPVVGLFIYNILDDDETKEYYQRTRLELRNMDTLKQQKAPREERMARWDTFHDEVTTFKTFSQKMKEIGVPDDEIKIYQKFINDFKNGDSNYFHGDRPCFADFKLFAIIQWGFQSFEGSVDKYDILGDGFLRDWYNRVSAYNY